MKLRVIVVDNHTDGILCECESISVAHSVSCGFINSSVKILPSSLPWLKSEFDKDFNSVDVHYQHIFAKINNMNPSLITEKWISLKKLALMRNNFHLAWETRCNQFLLNRNIEYSNLQMFETFIWRELDRCRPEDDFYTQAIHEWATLSNIDTSSAYQELKLKAESRGLQYVRNHAIHQKYVFLLNQETTLEKLQAVIADGLNQLVYKSLL